MACRLCLVLLLPAKVLVIEASAVGAPQTGQLPSCTDSCISADRITTHAISLNIYITAIDCMSTPLYIAKVYSKTLARSTAILTEQNIQTLII